jgi:GT2 family glycosyltransferase
MPKIMIAVPCMDYVPALFAQSLATLQKPENTALAMKMGSLIYVSRNNLATMAIEGEFDYVFWMDSDMTFPEDCLVRMLHTMQERDLDILTGVYHRRVPPYTPTLFDILEMRGELCSWTQFHDIPDEIFEIGGCGFGCVLMKTDAFIDVQGKFGNMFAPIANNGEDIAFCWRARQCGYKIYCDPSIQCGHIGHVIVDSEFRKAFKGVEKHESKST